MKNTKLKKILSVLLGLALVFGLTLGSLFWDYSAQAAMTDDSEDYYDSDEDYDDEDSDDYDDEDDEDYYDDEDDYDDEEEEDEWFDSQGLHITSGGTLDEMDSSVKAKLVLPDTVKKIENFSVSSKVKSLTISKNVTKIGTDAFSDATGLREIKVAKGNKNFIVRNKCLYTKKNVLLYVPRNSTKVTIYSKTKAINSNAFNGCNKLTTVTIPKSVNKVMRGAFYYNKKLVSIVVKGKNTKFYTGSVQGNKVNYVKNTTTGKMPSKKGYLTITCPNNSKAAKYAKKSNILYVTK